MDIHYRKTNVLPASHERQHESEPQGDSATPPGISQGLLFGGNTTPTDNLESGRHGHWSGLSWLVRVLLMEAVDG